MGELTPFPNRHPLTHAAVSEARIFKRLWSPGIDSKETIPPAYVAWRAGTINLFYSVQAPIDCLKITALFIC
jgi:hypothetical protein